MYKYFYDRIATVIVVISRTLNRIQHTVDRFRKGYFITRKFLLIATLRFCVDIYFLKKVIKILYLTSEKKLFFLRHKLLNMKEFERFEFTFES